MSNTAKSFDILASQLERST